MTAILAVENLVKKYEDFKAVKGISFSVEESEVFGLLAGVAVAFFLIAIWRFRFE